MLYEVTTKNESDNPEPLLQEKKKKQTDLDS